MFYKFHKCRRTLFSLFNFWYKDSYHLVVSDEFGARYSDSVPEAIEERMYHFMKTRGFEVEWMYREYVKVTVKGKAQKAQFAMINVGVLEIEPYKPSKVPVFKV